MKKEIATFMICFVIAFGAGYLYYDTISADEGQMTTGQIDAGGTAESKDVKQEGTTQEGTSRAGTTAASENGEIFNRLGCISCHAVSALNVKGGATGPDLSKAYLEVKDKHGVSIEEFLQKPTSAVMSSVIGAKPLTDEEIKSVVAALKAAAEAK